MLILVSTFYPHFFVLYGPSTAIWASEIFYSDSRNTHFSLSSAVGADFLFYSMEIGISFELLLIALSNLFSFGFCLEKTVS